MNLCTIKAETLRISSFTMTKESLGFINALKMDVSAKFAMHREIKTRLLYVSVINVEIAVQLTILQIM